MSDARDQQERFLRDFHRRHPGVTARAFSRGRVAGGGSSYDALARAVGPGVGRVVDLGCGDGALLAVLIAGGAAPAALVGVDLSRDELAAAAARRLGVGLVHARAQSLPLGDATTDVVVSHLAFTLMRDPDLVAAEVQRVLAPSGRFVTVVGGGPRGDDAYAGAVELVLPAARAAAAAGPAMPRLGEVRARSDRGLCAIFAVERGWSALAIEELPVDLSGSPDEVWSTMSTLYELDGVVAAEVDEVRARFLAACARWRRDDGAIACTMATRLVAATRV